MKNKIIVLSKNETITDSLSSTNDFFDLTVVRDVNSLIKLMKTIPYKAIAVDSLEELTSLDQTTDFIDEQVPVLLFHQNCQHLDMDIKKKLKNQIWHFNSDPLNKKFLKQFYLLHLTMVKHLQIDESDCYHYTFKTSMDKIEVVADHLNQYLSLILNNQNKIYDFYVNLILRELLTNAVKHGNELNPEKNVFIIIYFSNKYQKIGIIVKDEGVGFDFNNSLENIETDDLRQQQRGLFLIKKICDKVYNHKNLVAVELYYTE